MNELFLPTWLVGLLLGLSMLIVLKGQLGWAVGIYVALPSWMIVIRFGSINHLYIYLATMAGAALFYRMRKPKKHWLPQRDRWIVGLYTLWILWILIMLANNQGAQAINDGVRQSILLYIVAPLPFLLLIAKDNDAERSFAIAYVTTMGIGGIVILSRLQSTIGVSLSQLVRDPFLGSVNGSGVQWVAYALGLYNWHWFAYGCGIALLLAIVLWALTDRAIIQLVMFPVMLFFIYLLLLVGSRQSTLSALIVSTLLIIWLRPRISVMGYMSLGILASIILISLSIILTTRSELLVRNYNSLGNAFNPFADRANAWADGWHAFLQSPIWGDWFSGSPSLGHNYFISTLANQGIIGAVFLVGVMFFIIKQLRRILYWSPHHTTEIWRIAFFAIGLFSFLTAQVSGSPVSNWPIMWAAVVLWKYQQHTMATKISSRFYSATPQVVILRQVQKQVG